MACSAALALTLGALVAISCASAQLTNMTTPDDGNVTMSRLHDGSPLATFASSLFLTGENLLQIAMIAFSLLILLNTSRAMLTYVRDNSPQLLGILPSNNSQPLLSQVEVDKLTKLFYDSFESYSCQQRLLCEIGALAPKPNTAKKVLSLMELMVPSRLLDFLTQIRTGMQSPETCPQIACDVVPSTPS